MIKIIFIFTSTLALSAASADLTDIINAGEKKCLQVMQTPIVTVEGYRDREKMSFMLYAYRTFREASSYVRLDKGEEFLNELLYNATAKANTILNVGLKSAIIADLEQFKAIDWVAYAKSSLISESAIAKHSFVPIKE